MAHIEHVPNEAIWLDRVTLYDCLVCQRPVPSQYEGPELPRITCLGAHGGSGHTLVWEDAMPAVPDEASAVVPDEAPEAGA